VLVDRDGTIVIDEPYNGDPAKVQPVPGARAAIDRIRARGLPVGVLTNQSGVGRGLITMQQMEAVNRRIDELLGPFDGWFICPHAPDEACECRKPKPGLLLEAARKFGVEPESIVVIGDSDADIGAARNAGAGAIRIDAQTSLSDAVDALLARSA